MNKAWLIDTDIMIDYLRGVPGAIKFVEEAVQKQCFLSVITIAELYSGVKEGRERQMLDVVCDYFEIIALDKGIAQTGGIFRRDYNKSHGVGLADALIAASAEGVGASLATLNKKHFPMLKNVFVPYSKTN